MELRVFGNGLNNASALEGPCFPVMPLKDSHENRQRCSQKQAKKRLFRKVKGFVGGRRKLLRTAKETLIRAGVYAFRDRRNRKREFRKLWIIRINAAVRQRGMRYSQFIAALSKAEDRVGPQDPRRTWPSAIRRPSTRSLPRPRKPCRRPTAPSCRASRRWGQMFR